MFSKSSSCRNKLKSPPLPPPLPKGERKLSSVPMDWAEHEGKLTADRTAAGSMSELLVRTVWERVS